MIERSLGGRAIALGLWCLAGCSPAPDAVVPPSASAGPRASASAAAAGTAPPPAPLVDPAFGSKAPPTVAVAEGYACAVRKDGRVSCWGTNEAGQLGFGDTTPRQGPVVVPGVEDAVEVVAADEHACARTNGGAVWCWGDGEWFRLGSKRAAGAHAPVKVPDVADAVRVAVSRFHGCAVLAGGGLRCWGDPGGGRLGLDHLDHVTEPANVAMDAKNVTGVALSSDMTCYRDGAGKVACWGLGEDRDANQRHEVAVKDVVAFAPASYMTCVVDTAGVVTCWGPRTPPKVDEAVPKGLTNVVLGAFGCGVGTAGVVCWDAYALTRGAMLEDPENTDELVRYETLVGAKELHASSRAACVRAADGDVFCWGDNTEGQLGRSPGGVHPSPVTVPFADEAVALAAASDRTCAVGKDRKVRCWGDGLKWGVREKLHTEIAGVSMVSAGPSHTCALVAGGRVACWGQSGQFGELGKGPPPKKTPDASAGLLSLLGSSHGEGYVTAVDGIRAARSVAAARDKSCALTPGGVWCWGDDGASSQAQPFSWGPCSVFSRNDARCNELQKPHAIAGTKGAKALAGTSWGFCALLATGDVTCWRDRSAQLVSRAANTVSLHRGHDKLCALDAAGALACWDDGFVASAGGAFGAPLVDWSGGHGFECGVTQSGGVSCMGLGADGQLGNGERSTEDRPVAVKGISDAVKVSAGSAHACALLATGEVRCWGAGDAQVGKAPDTLPHASQPVRIALE